MIDVVERLPRRRPAAGIGLLTDEPRLPRAIGRDAGDFLDLALGRDRIGRLRRIGHQHQVDLVLHDQVFRDLRRAVRIRLAVLDDHFDRTRAALHRKAVLRRFRKCGEREIVGFRESGERTGLRRDKTNLDRPRLRVNGGRIDRAGRSGRAGILQQRAAVDACE